MRRALALSLAIAGAASLLHGCELALLGAAGGLTYTAIKDRRTSGTQIEDAGIELRASNRISARYPQQVHFNVNSYNREVLLTGEVPDEATKIDIGKIVAGLPNVRGVINELQIAGPSSMGSRTNDSYLTSKIKTRFLEAKRFNAVNVKVVTEASVVYLMGIVTPQEAEEAVDIARRTGGVRKVVKVFEYCSPSDEVCRPAPAAGQQNPS